MIPEEKQSAVNRALHAALGVSGYDEIHPLTRGLSSAQIYRIVVEGRSYLLRVILRTDAIADPTRQFACMEVAAAAGIAPRVLYGSVEDRVLISEFVDSVPLPKDMAMQMATTLRILHSLPPFPKIFTYLDVMDGFVQRFLGLDLLPAEEVSEFREGYAQLIDVYPREQADLVSCHNDLKPDNVLFDGRQVWLVDWEAAFLNDRYCDLAVAANFYLEDEEAASEAYLQTYFGEAPGARRLAQFFLMRQLMSANYAAYFLMLATGTLKPGEGAVKPFTGGDATIDLAMPLPGFREFHDRLIANEISMLDRQAQAQYGLIHLREALRQMRTQRFTDAIAMIAADS